MRKTIPFPSFNVLKSPVKKLLFLMVLFTLTGIVSFAQTSWKGTSSSSWSNSNNWTAGVPDALDDVTIGDASFTGAYQPSLSNVASCKSLTIGGTKASTLTAAYNLTVTNGVTINSNGFLSSKATLTLGGNWSNSGNYSDTTSTSQIIFAGTTQSIGGTSVTTFRALTINAGSTVTLNRNMTVAGTGSLMTINGTFDPNDSPTYTATITNLTINGTIRVNAAVYTTNYILAGAITLTPGFTVEYGSSTVNQNITNLLSYSNLKISGTSVKTIPGNLTFQSTSSTIGNIYIAGGTLDIAGYTINRATGITGGTLSVSNGATLKIGGINSFPTGFNTVTLGASSTIEYNGSTQSITSRSYGNLAISALGTKTAAGALTIAGDLSLSTATFVAGAYTHSVAGDWNMTSGVYTNTGNTILFNGTGAQSVSTTGAFNNVTINKSAGSVSTTTDMTVKALTFTKGILNSDVNEVIIPSGGTVTGASATTGWVNGRLQKYYSAAAGGTFEVGGPSHYTPLSVVFASVTTAGSLIAGVTASSHPNISSSTIPSKNISRYWTLDKPTTGAIVYTSATLTFNWNTADNYSPLTTTALKVAKYTSAAWTYPTVTGTSTATSMKASAVSTLGDFAIGETTVCTISSGFKYASGNYCSNGGTANITLNSGATAGTFTSSPAGLSINSATGAVNLNSSTPGTYTVTNTAVSGTCTSISTTTIVVNLAASATISYGATAKCVTGTDAAVTLTGTSGGVFSSTTGLSIDGATGLIDVSASKPGTYTVTYTVTGLSGCANFVTTTTVTINTPPSASISYPGTPYCTNGGAAMPTLFGTTGGTFSSTTGLVITAATGAVNLATSTAGTYTVTYTVAAANGCAVLTATTTIVIVSKPTATITYGASTYCTTAATATPTITGTAGGVFSSALGLDLNEVTGAISPSTSTAGTYTVTYSVSAISGCSASSTTTVTITAAPTSTIAYASPLCQNGGTAAVIFTGTTGGTFTSTTGLSINAATGAITLASSTAGTYTVTYTIAASGGCAALVKTTSVTITSAPTAAIAYSGSPFCTSGTTVTVTRTGTAGGTYTSTTGLSIDATTGTINLASSTAGTYTVTYTLAAANGCLAVTATASVNITAAPTATIVYSGSPFCPSSGIISVTRTGTAGGVYSITGGLPIDAATGDITLSSGTIGTYTVTYSIAASGGCTAFSTTTTIFISKATWTGNISNDWNDDHNWSCNHKPDDKTPVMIPSGLSRYPVINSNLIVKSFDLTVQSGATLTVNGVLQLIGTITSSGGINATGGSITMFGTTAQVIPAGVFTNNEVEDLTINNLAGVTLGGTLNLTDILILSNGALTTGDYLTLKSTAANTARVSNITSKAATPIIGNVTVERYVQGRRKYRMITSSVTTSASSTLVAGQESQSIWGNWQNQGNNTTANVGTIITGGSTADGFDQQTTGTSLYTYNATTKKFVAFSTAAGNNTKYTPLKAGMPYYMFVYGDRLNTITTKTPNNTTLKATGTLLTGNQVYDTTSTSVIRLAKNVGDYTLLGNPYAAIIDWKSVLVKNISKTIWAWDPNLSSTGGYVTVTTSLAGAIISPLSSLIKANQYVQPGQAFFVQTTAAGPSITIKEVNKVDTAININSSVFRTTGGGTTIPQPLMAVNLIYDNAGTPTLADGAVAAFDTSYSKDVTDEDGLKMANSTEAIVFANGTNALTIDALPIPQDNDTLALNVLRLTKTQYTLQIFANNMDGYNATPYLVDAYLHTTKALSLTDTNNIVFNVNLATAASSAANRFSIVFRVATTLPVTFTSVTAAPKDKNVLVEWSVAQESNIKLYEVEHSTDGITFTKASEVTAKGNSLSANYQWLDDNITTANNYYRIKAVEPDGQYFYSKVVMVKQTVVKGFINVYPNPIQNQINIQLNGLEKGRYTLLLVNSQGQLMLTSIIDNAGGITTKVVTPNNKLTPGIYYLKLVNENGTYSEAIHVE